MTRRAGENLQRLAARLHQAAATGSVLPTLSALAEELDLSSPSNIRVLLRQGERAGLWLVTNAAHGLAEITAADGSWRVQGSASARGPAAPLPTRRCLRCRSFFRPQHRHNFLCGCYVDTDAVA